MTVTAEVPFGVVPLFHELVTQGDIYDLAHPMSTDMPVYSRHAPYSLTLHRRHGDAHPSPRADGSSFANEVIVMPGHVSTHIDALGHFSVHGCLHGGVPAQAVEGRDGLTDLHAGQIAPIWRRGILLDAAAHRGCDVLDPKTVLGPEELAAIAERQQTPLRPGDAVFVRTGWSHHWQNSAVFNGDNNPLPGPCARGAQWLLDQGARMVGSDTPAFEAIPAPAGSAHVLLLVEHGVHIVENLNLEELSQDGVHRFLLIGLPLRIVGATGSPMRPLALR